MRNKSRHAQFLRQTLEEIYENYRDEMKSTLDLEQIYPDRFLDAEFSAYFKQRVEQLDTLIAFYHALIIASKNRN